MDACAHARRRPTTSMLELSGRRSEPATRKPTGITNDLQLERGRVFELRDVDVPEGGGATMQAGKRPHSRKCCYRVYACRVRGDKSHDFRTGGARNPRIP